MIKKPNDKQLALGTGHGIQELMVSDVELV